MRLLFVGKRHPQQRDLIERPYGRFHYLPTAMAALGHTVEVLLCSHRRLPSHESFDGGVQWRSDDVRLLGPHAWMRTVSAQAAAFRPDWVIGASDAWFGWLAQRLARHTGAALAVDAYDNFEAYMPWNLPLHLAWRRAVAAADLVTAPGPQLADLLNRQRCGRRPTQILPMAADPMFVPRNSANSRAELGLPLHSPLIGYTGGWARNRGTDILIDAFRRLRARRPEARLVLSGRPPAYALAEPGALALGYLDDCQLPVALSALDVACVITANTSFGRYSYPAKLCEAMACRVPVVATDTAPVRWMLHDDTRFLASVGDADSVARRMHEVLAMGPIDYGRLTGWNEAALTLETLLTTEN